MRLTFRFHLVMAALVTIGSLSLKMTPAQAQAPHQVEIVAQRFQFTPSEITLKKGEPVVLVLTSKDVTHGLKLDAFNQTMKAEKGKSSKVSFTPDKAGDFVAQCAVFCGAGHGSMKLTIHVTE
jgi:cytochrome c oxidase subunit II